MAERADRLVTFVRRRAGDGVRVVGTYADEAYELHYVRDDLEEERVRQALAQVHRNLTAGREDESLLRERLGSESASVQLRRDGVVLHLRSEGAGAILSLERGVARNLDMFSQQCLDVMYGSR
ncbi:MAG: hypothetical protein ABEJ28_11200 [Salinigranum sp.]